MTERQKKWTIDYGPRFIVRSHHIMNEFLHLQADACSILTNEEFKECGAKIEDLITELQKTKEFVWKRLEEAAGNKVEAEKLVMQQKRKMENSQNLQG